MSDRPRYMISVAAGSAGMYLKTLRAYEAKGLVAPAETPGEPGLYSSRTSSGCRLIQQLTTKLGLNLAGVEHVLRLEDASPPPRPDGAPRGGAPNRDPRDPQAVPA